jgi:DNA-binding beta-propeller fold protein YncE
MLTADDRTPTEDLQLAPAEDRAGRRRRRGVLLVALLALVAGGVAWAVLREGAIDDRILVVDEDGAVSLLDPETGEALVEVAGATATPDRSALLTTDSNGRTTTLQSRDPVTGEVTGSTQLEGDLTVRTVSPRGTAVALLPGPKGAGLYVPEARERTSLTVSYLDDRPARTYDLPGNIEPEMFSLDEDGLFVLQFEPPTDPTSYVVRRLDLATGEVADTESDQVELTDKMRGKARAQVLHPDGTYLFTLYTLPNTGEPVYDVAADDGAARYAFVHVINLEEEWSYCIFLPTPIGTVNEAAVGMGISPDGEELIVADPAADTVVRIDTEALVVRETTPVGQLTDHGTKATVAVTEGGTVYVGSGPALFELDAATLQPIHAWNLAPPASPISGLSVSATGDQLRVAGDGVITLVDRATRTETGVLHVPGRGTVTLLGPPRGSVTEYPLECAC